jgi:UDP-2,4-diacetamido-2,4,6-trideoxy-beta-L-altropyranose hydrolase
MSHSSPLLIRADGDTTMGTGHVMRCLALAQAWHEAGGPVTFAMAASTPALQHRLESEGMHVRHIAAERGSPEDTRQTTALARQLDVAWIVADGYHFGAAFQAQLKAAGHRLLLVDDYGHSDHYSADLVLNQNIHADPAVYRNREPATRLLLGTDYTMLRREFWPWREWQREIPSIARHVLITFGGSDPDNVTLLVLHALQQAALTELAATVLVGGSNPHHATLQAAATDSPFPVSIQQNVTDMPGLLAEIDVAISAGSSMCWELAYMQVPILGISRAMQEEILLQASTQHGVSQNLGHYHTLHSRSIAHTLHALVTDQAQRRTMAHNGRATIDGRGVTRILHTMHAAQKKG